MSKKFKQEDGVIMEDGSIAWLTVSGNYYARREPDFENWTAIAYYTLAGIRIPLAKAKCGYCEQVIESKTCGDFVSCGCGKSFVDTDRSFPERHRYGGDDCIQLDN